MPLLPGDEIDVRVFDLRNHGWVREDISITAANSVVAHDVSQFGVGESAVDDEFRHANRGRSDDVEIRASFAGDRISFVVPEHGIKDREILSFKDGDHVGHLRGDSFTNIELFEEGVASRHQYGKAVVDTQSHVDFEQIAPHEQSVHMGVEMSEWDT